MPDSEPKTGAPETLWVGGEEGVALAGALGVGWAAPLFALGQTRVVNIAALCAAPPPVFQPLTTSDLFDHLNPALREGVEQKLRDFVDAAVWERNCEYADPEEPPYVVPYQPAPPDAPPEPTPSLGTMISRMYQWAQFMLPEVVTRHYEYGEEFLITDHGQQSSFVGPASDWPVDCCGFQVEIITIPDYAAHWPGTEPSIYWDLGWISWGSQGFSENPVRLQKVLQLVYPITEGCDTFTWQLKEGVEAIVRPLFPRTTKVVE